MKFDMTKPCPHCPFRNDIPGYLTDDRVYEIAASLVRGTFACHETTEPVEDDDAACDMRATSDSQHCAGALILLEKLNRPSQLMRICERLGLYDRKRLDMDSPVFNDFDEMADAQ